MRCLMALAVCNTGYDVQAAIDTRMHARINGHGGSKPYHRHGLTQAYTVFSRLPLRLPLHMLVSCTRWCLCSRASFTHSHFLFLVLSLWLCSQISQTHIRSHARPVLLA